MRWRSRAAELHCHAIDPLQLIVSTVFVYAATCKKGGYIVRTTNRDAIRREQIAVASYSFGHCLTTVLATLRAHLSRENEKKGGRLADEVREYWIRRTLIFGECTFKHPAALGSDPGNPETCIARARAKSSATDRIFKPA